MAKGGAAARKARGGSSKTFTRDLVRLFDMHGAVEWSGAWHPHGTPSPCCCSGGGGGRPDRFGTLPIALSSDFELASCCATGAVDGREICFHKQNSMAAFKHLHGISQSKFDGESWKSFHRQLNFYRFSANEAKNKLKVNREKGVAFFSHPDPAFNRDMLDMSALDAYCTNTKTKAAAPQGTDEALASASAGASTTTANTRRGRPAACAPAASAQAARRSRRKAVVLPEASVPRVRSGRLSRSTRTGSTTAAGYATAIHVPVPSFAATNVAPAAPASHDTKPDFGSAPAMHVDADASGPAAGAASPQPSDSVSGAKRKRSEDTGASGSGSRGRKLRKGRAGNVASASLPQAKPPSVAAAAAGVSVLDDAAASSSLGAAAAVAAASSAHSASGGSGPAASGSADDMFEPFGVIQMEIRSKDAAEIREAV